jgi:hypothetical protein
MALRAPCSSDVRSASSAGLRPGFTSAMANEARRKRNALGSVPAPPTSPAANAATGTSTYQRLRNGAPRTSTAPPSSQIHATAKVETIAQNPAKSGV